MSLSIPDHQLCYDPARILKMTVADYAKLTLQEAPREKAGLTILAAEEETELSATLADAQRQFAAARQAQREQQTPR
jgi:hypothetical protein